MNQRIHRARIPYLVTLLSILVGGTVTVPFVAPAAHAEGLGATYVALGDSFSSGEGLDGYDSTNGCDRSSLSYPKQLNPSRVSDFLHNLDFVACSGAEMKDMFNTNQTHPDEVAQLNAVTDDARIVTATIGGNDVGFADVLTDCIWGGSASGILNSQVRGRPNCAGRQKDSVNEKLRILAKDDSAKQDNYVSLIAAIQDKSPLATIYLGGYPHLFGAETTMSPAARAGCRVGQVNALLPLYISQPDVAWLNRRVDALNNTISKAVNKMRSRGFRVHYVAPDMSGHGLCDTGVSWIKGLFLDKDHNPLAKSFHPEKQGQLSYTIAFRQEIADTVPDEAFRYEFTATAAEPIDQQIGFGATRSVQLYPGGQLPPGLKRVRDHLTGTPTTPGTYSVLVDIQDRKEGLLRILVTVTVVSNPTAHYTSTTGLDGSGGLSMACPDADSCLLMEPSGTYATYDASTWTGPTTPRITDSLEFNVSQDGNGVSCPTANLCFAVVPGQGVFISTTRGATWTLVYENADLELISCPSDSYCMATGGSAAIYRNGAWADAPQATTPDPAYSLACASETSCVAGGRNLLMRWQGDVWATLASPLSEINIHAACMSNDFCVIGSRTGQYSVWDGSWSTRPRTLHYVSGISCTTTYCMGFEWEVSRYTIFRPGSDTDETGTVVARQQPFSNAGDVLACAPTGPCYIAFHSGDVSRWNGAEWEPMAGDHDGTFHPGGD